MVRQRIYPEDDDNSRADGWSAVCATEIREGQFDVYLPLVRGHE